MTVLKLQHAKNKLSPWYDQTNNWNKSNLSPDCDDTVVKLLPSCLLSLGYSLTSATRSKTLDMIVFRSVKKWVRSFSACNMEMFTNEVSMLIVSEAPCSVRVTLCTRGANLFHYIKGAYSPLYIIHLIAKKEIQDAKTNKCLADWNLSNIEPTFKHWRWQWWLQTTSQSRFWRQNIKTQTVFHRQNILQMLY